MIYVVCIYDPLISVIRPGDLPDPGIEPASLALAGGFFITEPPGKTVVQFACLKEGGNEGMGGGRTLLS